MSEKGLDPQNSSSSRLINSTSQKERSFDLFDFIPQNKIGSGSYGNIYKVKDKKTGQMLVAKISINRIEKDSTSLLLDISREVNILSKLNHPSILKFIYYCPFNFKKKPKPVIITEFASNGSLEDLIKKERESHLNFDMTHKLIIIYGIASAMSYLHQHNIIHRDLKPANILLDDFLFPKVADFGLSKVSDNFERNNSISIKGTPIYISPEIWTKVEYSPPCDVYAFSFIVYELITNIKPFDKFNFYQIPIEIQKGYRPPINIQIPESYRNLIQDCWSQDPSQRPTFDEILERLTNDNGFITEKVDQIEYFKYVNYIKECKSSFDSNKNVFYFDVYSNFNRVKVNEKEVNNSLPIINKTSLFQFKDYCKLDEECRKILDDVKDDPEKQYKVGVSLIEGHEHFPQNTQVGLKYLKKSIKNGYLESTVYYCKMLIKGQIIPRNLLKASKLIRQKLNNELRGISSYLLGSIEKVKQNYEEAKKYFIESFEHGSDESMYEYGKMLYKGLGIPIDKEKAIEYYKQSIEKGNLKSMFLYGKMKKEGEYVEKNVEEGISLIRMSADKGYPEASYYYSLMLEKGDEVSIDKEEMLRYLKSAASKGHIESMRKYSIEIKLKSNDPNNIKESVIFSKKASDKGHIESMYNYGMMLYEGDGIQKDRKESAKYFKISAYNGNSDAMVQYGEMLLYGKGIPVNEKEGVELILLAIKQDNDKAMNRYGLMLRNGEGVPINKEEAIKYYKKAIEKGNDSAMCNYGYMFQIGDFVPVDKEEAIKYYKKAIELGNGAAMKNYADMLQYGEGVEINKEEAIKYYKMAIDKGNKEALINYYHMFEYEEEDSSYKQESINLFKKAIDKGDQDAMNKYGILIYQSNKNQANKEEAIEYFKKAADLGDTDAMVNYAIMLLEREENPSESTKEEAIKYFKLSIQSGNSNAMYNFALYLLLGEKLDKNIEEAIKYYKMAIDDGNTPAMHQYGYFIYKGLIPSSSSDNKEEGLKYIKMAADRGHFKALRDICLVLYENNNYINNQEEILKYLKMGIERGDDIAMNGYATLLREGKLQNESKEDSIKYLKMACLRGNAVAMYNYGIMLYSGIVVEVNKEEGKKYLKMASDRGSDLAAYNLAGALFIENGRKFNEEIAKYYKIAADKGHIEAIQTYASLLYTGNGIPIDREEGKRYLKIAIDKGDANSMYYLGLFISNFEESNREEVIKYLKMAADHGHVKAMKEYGSILYHGRNDYINKEEAFKYIKMAAEKGDTECMIFCADMLYNGDGIESNKEEGIKYYKLAAENGDVNGMSKYGEILFNGIESNKEEGIKYIIKAASSGDINSLYNYGMLLFNGDGVEMNKEEAIKYIKIAADKGNANAMYFYGTLLEEGKYVEQNPEESIKYYRNSANKQNIDAIRRYSCILDEEEKKRNYDEFKYNKNKETKIKRRRSFSFIDFDKSSVFSKLDDETCKTEFINAEYNEIDSTFYVAKSFIEGINKFPQNVEIGKKYLERSIKAKDSEAIQYYSKMISISDKEKAVYLLNEIATNYQNSYSKLSLVKQILSKESFDVNVPTSSQSVNYTLAKRLSKEASKIGNSKAMILYSKLSSKNKKNQISEIRFNFRESFQYIKRAAKMGDREAMSFYGLHLERGFGCSKKKRDKAYQYYKKSYEKGDLNGYAYYGSFLIEHNKEEEEGLRLIKYSCDHNNAKGIHLYGFYSFNGLSILEKNEQRAFNCFKLSQSMGNDISFNNVGTFYEKGICTNADKKEAIKYYEKGFEEGYLICGCQLGNLLINSDDEKGLNFSEGMKYLKIASENGDVDSMYYYCLNIYKNKSTINEIAEMKYYLNKGVYLKDTDLIVLYANILIQNNNYPLEQDCVKAAKLYKLSADLGDCSGMVKFAKMLLIGNGIEANQSESLKYFKMAADKGDIQAMIDYASNLSKCEEGTFDKEEVIKYYKLAVEQGNSDPNIDLSEAKRYLDLNENKSPK